MFQVVLNEDGTITIPSAILEELGIKPGDDIEFYIEDDYVVLVKK